jgi:hypothetical protein
MRAVIFLLKGKKYLTRMERVMAKNDSHRLARLEAKLDKLAETLEKARFKEYLEYLGDRRKVLFNSFLIGIARGLGMVVGLTLLGALLIYLLRSVAKANLPLIGDFIADIVRIVDSKL